jgi:flagellar biosynthesis protein FliP
MANLGNVTSGWLQMKTPLIPALGLAFLAGALLASPALAQEVTLNLGDDGSVAARSIQLIVLITLLSLVPGLAIMITCFPFIVTVLAILRQAIGLQQSPPNMLIVTLALFLTYFVMEPVFLAAWADGIEPLINDGIPVEQAFMQTLGPFREFMSGRIDVDTFEALAALRPDLAQSTPVPDAPLSVLVPSFLLSEIARAFQIGFIIFLPFLIIDLVVAAILMSMGMMMVPPAIVSLPFKLAFFVVADGWSLIASSLVRSYL